MKQFLVNYFSQVEIESALNDISNKKRTYLMNDKYFAKICIKTDGSNYENILLEIDLYQENDNIFNDIYIDSIVTDNYCILILKKIEAMPLAKYRNDFNNKLTKDIRKRICKEIANIKTLHIVKNNLITISREEMFNKYLINAKKYLDNTIIEKLNYYKKELCLQNDFVISHGDLILTNILINNDMVNFIDWEYLAKRSSTYDIAYFLLFSKKNKCLNILKNSSDFLEICKDGVIICLKEIHNWHKLYHKIADNIFERNISRWVCELENIIEEMIKYETINNSTSV